MKHYIVYKTTNLLTGEFYVGVHGQSSDDGYLGSGIHLKRQLKKYGKGNFQRQTLGSFAAEKEAFQHEIDVLKDLIDDPLCINISPGGDGGSRFSGKRHSEETKKKLREASLGNSIPAEARAKIAEANRRRFSTEEGKRVHSEAMKKYHAKKRSQHTTEAV